MSASLSLALRPSKAFLAHYGEKVVIHLPPVYSGSADTDGWRVLSCGLRNWGRLGRGEDGGGQEASQVGYSSLLQLSLS